MFKIPENSYGNTVKDNTYPSRRMAFVMSSTFFLVSTKIIVLFPLSTPISRSSLDNLSTQNIRLTTKETTCFYRNQVWSTNSIYRGRRSKLLTCKNTNRENKSYFPLNTSIWKEYIRNYKSAMFLSVISATCAVARNFKVLHHHIRNVKKEKPGMSYKIGRYVYDLTTHAQLQWFISCYHQTEI